MKQNIAHIALVVKDYDEAIQFYTQKLGFTLIEDTKLSEEKRWVLVKPPGAKECSILLAKPQMKNKALRSEIKLVEEFFFSCLLIIS